MMLHPDLVQIEPVGVSFGPQNSRLLAVKTVGTASFSHRQNRNTWLCSTATVASVCFEIRNKPKA